MKSMIIKNLLRIGLEKGLNAKKPQYTGLKIIAAILFLIAVIYALIAVHQILMVEYGLINANLFFAAGFAALSLLTFIVVAIKQSNAKGPRYNPDVDGTIRAIKAPLEEKAELASIQLQRSIYKNTGKAILAATVIGLFLGAKTRK